MRDSVHSREHEIERAETAGISNSIDLRLRRVRQIVQAISEERKVAAKDNMRSEADHRRDLLLFEKVGDEAFKCNLSLSERALIERCENFSGLNQQGPIAGTDRL